jgi:tetratricopeptide (TPR) repeat protein
MSEAPRVFISYSHDTQEHMDRVLGLSNDLRQKGIDCSIDQYEESPPEGWPLWCERQVEKSEFALVACTETYLRRFKGEEQPEKGLGVVWEGHIVTQELYNAQGSNTKFIPLVFFAHEAAYIPLILQSATYYNAGDADGLERLYRRLTGQPAIVKPALGKLDRMPPRGAPAGLNALPQLDRKQNFRQPWNLPISPSPFFTGRDEALKEIDAAFKAGKAAALCGLGGVGKTQTAARYALLHRRDYQAVLWVSAATREALLSGFAALASLLNLPEAGAQEQGVAVSAVKRWMERSSDWLLILDNANDLAVVREFGLPAAASGRLLLTTQAHALGGLGHRVGIEEMEPDEGASLLLRRASLLGEEESLSVAAGADREMARQISEELGGLPLALDQAGAYIEETGCSLERYLELYRRKGAELHERRGGVAPDHLSVAATFALSFGNVKQASEPAAEILRLCALLAPEAIPEEILAKGGVDLGPILAPAAADPLKLDAALAAAMRYSLLRRRDGTLRIHRLVQEVIRDGMTEEERRQWAERAVRAVNRAFPPVEFANWGQCERFLSQGLACAKLITGLGIETQEAARLLNGVAYYLCERARYAEAEPLYRRSLAIREKALGPDHSDVAQSLNNLAVLYKAQGRYAEAEPLYQRSLKIWEKALGPDHPEVATGLNNLALLYDAQGRYAEAEPLYRRSLEIWEKALGRNHPDVANSLNNLAALYKAQGGYAEAEPLYQRSLAIREKALGAGHPDVAASLNNLAELYREQSRYAEAEPLYGRALAIDEKALGSSHPSLATDLNNLALLYDAQGRYAEAEPLYQRSLAIWEKALGPDHPQAAISLNNLANLHREQSRYAEAEPLHGRALAIREKALGPDHPDVATSLNNLGTLYDAQGRYAEAEPLYQRSLAIWEKALGPDHPQVSISLNNLANLYREQGRHAEAEPLFRRSLAIREKALGLDHPKVATALESYASLLRKTGRENEAAQMETRAKSIRTRHASRNPG